MSFKFYSQSYEIITFQLNHSKITISSFTKLRAIDTNDKIQSNRLEIKFKQGPNPTAHLHKMFKSTSEIVVTQTFVTGYLMKNLSRLQDNSH